jgi:hypothetical protein
MPFFMDLKFTQDSRYQLVIVVGSGPSQPLGRPW